MIFIEKHQLTLDGLKNIATKKPQTLAAIKSEITVSDEKLRQISLLQRHIGAYGKTKEIYKHYRLHKNPKQAEQFRLENAKSISDHEAARAYFDTHGYGFGEGKNKLPGVKELRERYAIHNAEKKSLWARYHEIKNSDRDIENAWANVKVLLNIGDDAVEASKEKEPVRKGSKGNKLDL